MVFLGRRLNRAKPTISLNPGMPRHRPQSSVPAHAILRGIHIIKARNNALFVNNSASHGAYTRACTESRSVLFEYLKLLCSSHVSVKLCGIVSNVHTICFHFFPNFYIVKSTISFLFIDWPP